MACALPHKSAASVNTSQERCDNFSITLGRRERCLCPRSWQVGLRGALCTLAALPLFLGTEGSKVRGKMYARVCMQRWCRSLLRVSVPVGSERGEMNRINLTTAPCGKKTAPLHSFQWSHCADEDGSEKRLSGKEVEPGSAFAASCFVQTHTCEYTFLVDFLFNTLPDDRSSWGENDLCSKILPRSVKPSDSLDLRLNLVFLHIPSSYWWLKLQTNAAPGPF